MRVAIMKKKVILLEINEITWRLIDPLIKADKLPTFSFLKKNGSWGSPMSVDLPPQLDPWITWTTVYTGRPQSDHGVFHLQQPAESVKVPRIWDLCHEAGLKVGVYGSLCSYPPKDTGAFYIPDTFSPDAETFPSELAPIQKLNLTYTRSARLPDDSDNTFSKAKMGAELLGLGLSAKTCSKLAAQLLSERFRPNVRWKRVALQPAVNFDFFSRLYRKHLPDLATFHTNHVAHYQHTYWKAMEPESFEQESSASEVSTYGSAIEHGYAAADDLLKKALAICDDDTILVVASSMGQQPYKSSLHEGKRIGQLRSLEVLAEIIGTDDRTKFLPVMSDQFNIYCENEDEKRRLKTAISEVYVDRPQSRLFHLDELDGFLTVTLNHSDEFNDDSVCRFPKDGAESTSYQFDEIIYRTGMTKSGCHHPEGILMIYGKGIPSAFIEETNNLDIAPTILSLLGLKTPAEMKGRSLVITKNDGNNRQAQLR